jgi:hypothetical protein
MGEKGNSYRDFIDKWKGNRPLRRPKLDGMITLIWLLEK